MDIHENTLAKLEYLLNRELSIQKIDKTSLRFAQRSGLGYKIVPGKVKNSEIWEALVKAIRKELPQLSTGQIADQIFLFIHG